MLTTTQTTLLAGALLNACLALLVWRVRPRRRANLVLAWLLGLNALAAFLLSIDVKFGHVLPMAADDPGNILWDVRIAYLVNLMSLVPLAVLPFVVPWRRLDARRERVLILIAVALVGGLIALTLLHYVFFDSPPVWIAGFLSALLVLTGIPVLGAIVLLDAAVGARTHAERGQAMIFLAAFALKLGALGPPVTMLSEWPILPGFPLTDPRLDAARTLAVVTSGTVWAVTPTALAAIVIGLASARYRAHRAGRDAPPLGEDAFVIGCAAFGLSIPVLGFPYETEYLLLRPLIFTFALLRFQIVPIDFERSTAIMVTAGVSAVAAASLFAVIWSGRVGLPAEVATAAAVTAALGMGAVIAWPLLRLGVATPSHADVENRRVLVYRAALEAARREGDVEAGATLRVLRGELGITDRDHALMEAEIARSDSGRTLKPGHMFLDRYRVVRTLGEGAFSEVVLARDERLGRDVAIKRLAGHQQRNASALKAFAREVRLAGSVQHPRLVTVHDVEAVGEDTFLVMEHVRGGSLRDRLDAEGTLVESEARAIASDVLEALEALHAHGLVHRDVKPANVLLEPVASALPERSRGGKKGGRRDGRDDHARADRLCDHTSGTAVRAKLSDFTIAAEAASGETLIPGGPEAVLGTPAYMAPEAARGLPATPRSDLYAVGVLIYECVTGRVPVPVSGLGAFEAAMRVAQDPPPLPIPTVTRELNAVLSRALAKDPEERYASAREMRSALVPVEAAGVAGRPDAGAAPARE